MIEQAWGIIDVTKHEDVQILDTVGHVLCEGAQHDYMRLLFHKVVGSWLNSWIIYK
jgi:hypothetical protein